jgi:multidrug efflux pump subunit AcrA (membrane-fusion protein)
MKRALFFLLFVAMAAAGGYYYYTEVYLPGQPASAEEAPLQTATVRRGDIVISAQGAGTLVPASELDLAFSSSGTLVELSVGVGDHVEAGQVVARLDDTDAANQVAQAEFDLAQAQQELVSLTSASALAAAQLEVVNKQIALEDAQKALDNLLTTDVGYYAEALAASQRDYDAVAANLEMTNVGSGSELRSLQSAQDNADSAYTTWQHYIIWYGEHHGRTESAKEAYELAAENLRVAQLRYDLALASQQASLAEAQEALDAAQASYNYAAHYEAPANDAALAEANVAVAEADLIQAQAALAELQGEPLPEGATSTLNAARNAMTQAELALDAARQALAATELVSPIAGTITAVNAVVGADVGASALLTVADLDNARVEFYVDETDLAYVAEGYPISIEFDSAPDIAFAGQVLRVDPALVTVNNTPVVKALATIEQADSAVRLIAGMNGTVEITAGEARGVLIIPIEALRELAPGSYAVFVVEADESLTLTPVAVGLRDVANAEILSGLEQGDRVSTGVVETIQ